MKIQIEWSEDYGDCETCGSYTNQRIIVRKDGDVVLDHLGDDHLGGGLVNEPTDALRLVLEALGFEVEIL